MDLLREVLEPSAVIHPDYKTYLIETSKGELVTGIILSQDAKVLRVVTNPQQAPREIPVKDVDSKIEAKVSMMPEGLLVTLNQDEILDLLAYLASGGNPNDPAFAARKEH